MTRRNDFDAIVAKLQEAERLAVTCHVNPDGDALGSMLGFAGAARLAGKEVVASFSEPFELPDSFEFLPIDTLVPPADFPTDAPVVVAFDAGDISRLGTLAEAAAAAETLIVVDHHVTNPGFGHLNYIDAEASASAQLAYDLIRTLDWPIDEAAANSLLVGLVTDTGKFLYSNTGAAALHIAGELVAAGASPSLIGTRLYENAPFGFVQVAGAVQQRARLEPDLSLVWSQLRPEDLIAAGIGGEEVEGLIDYIRIAREADVAVLLKLGDEGTKASLRSRRYANVGELASRHGGGGHARAAGFEHPGPPEEAIELIREFLRGD